MFSLTNGRERERETIPLFRIQTMVVCTSIFPCSLMKQKKFDQLHTLHSCVNYHPPFMIHVIWVKTTDKANENGNHAHIICGKESKIIENKVHISSIFMSPKWEITNIHVMCTVLWCSIMLRGSHSPLPLQIWTLPFDWKRIRQIWLWVGFID